MTEEEVATRYRNRIKRILKILGDIFGYEISIQGNKLFLRSNYAFEEEDTIALQIKETEEIALEETEFIRRMEKERRLYLEKGGSLAAFLAAVTLDLFEKKTFQ